MLPPRRTAAFEAFVAPARGRPALWRLGLGLALTAVVWAAVTAPILLLPPRTAEQAVLLMYLFGFGGMILGVGLAVRLLGRRRFSGLFGPAGFEPRGFLAAAAVMAGLAAVSVVVWLLVAGPARRTDVLSVGGLAAAGAAGGLRAERRRGAGVPRLPAAGAGGAVPVGGGVVAGAVGCCSGSCTGTRRSSGRTPGWRWPRRR